MMYSRGEPFLLVSDTKWTKLYFFQDIRGILIWVFSSPGSRTRSPWLSSPTGTVRNQRRILQNSLEEGGLGLRPVKLINKALLGKWLWIFLEERDSSSLRIHQGEVSHLYTSPSQRLPAVLFVFRLDAGKHALKHLEMVIQTFYLLPRGLSHSVVNLTKTSCLNELICFLFLWDRRMLNTDKDNEIITKQVNQASLQNSGN